MEIYERKHVLSALLDGAVILGGLVFSVVILCVLWSSPAIHVSGSAAVDSALTWMLVVLAVITFCLSGFYGWFLLDRHITLSLGHRPAVVITDDELQIYTPFGGYTSVRWDSISGFKHVVFNKWRRGYYPVYTDPGQNKGIYKKCFTETILTDYLSMPEEQLLEELNRRIS